MFGLGKRKSVLDQPWTYSKKDAEDREREEQNRCLMQCSDCGGFFFILDEQEEFVRPSKNLLFSCPFCNSDETREVTKDKNIFFKMRGEEKKAKSYSFFTIRDLTGLVSEAHNHHRITLICDGDDTNYVFDVGSRLISEGKNASYKRISAREKEKPVIGMLDKFRGLVGKKDEFENQPKSRLGDNEFEAKELAKKITEQPNLFFEFAREMPPALLEWLLSRYHVKGEKVFLISNNMLSGTYFPGDLILKSHSPPKPGDLAEMCYKSDNNYANGEVRILKVDVTDGSVLVRGYLDETMEAKISAQHITCVLEKVIKFGTPEWKKTINFLNIDFDKQDAITATKNNIEYVKKTGQFHDREKNLELLNKRLKELGSYSL